MEADGAPPQRGQVGYILDDLIHKSESKMAHLLGYKDLGAYRRFRFSPAVLAAYRLWKDALSQPPDGRRAVALILEMLGKSAAEIAQAFPKTLDALVQQYPTSETSNDGVSRRHREWRLAAVLYNLVHDVEAERMCDPTELAKRFSIEATTITQILKLEPSLPTFQASLITWPAWGPLDSLSEPLSAPYERAHQLLRNLQTVFSQGKWKSAFGSDHSDPFKTRAPARDQIPACMQLDANKPFSSLSLETPDGPAQSTDKFVVQWHVPADTPTGLKLRQHLGKLEVLKLPDLPSTPSPRAFPDEFAWRDHLRRALHLESNGVDFDKIVLCYGEQEDLIYDPRNQLQVEPWSRVLDTVKPVPSEPVTYSIRYECRPIEDVDNPYPYEYFGPPVQISSDVEVKENDIVERNTERETTTGRPAAPDGDTANAAKNNTTNDVDRAILDDAGTSSKPAGAGASAADGDGANAANGAGANAANGAGASAADGGVGAGAADGGAQPSGNNQQAGAGQAAPTRGVAMLRQLVEDERNFGPSTPAGLFQGRDESELFAYYDGHDARTPVGLDTWQKACIEALTRGFPITRRLRGYNEPEAEAGRRQLEREDFAADADLPTDHHDYRRIQAAFVGGIEQTGPPVKPSAELLGFVEVGKHGSAGIISKYRCTLLPDEVTAHFLDTQVNGIAWLLGRQHGVIPVHPGLSDPETKALIAQELSAPQLGGGVVVDNVGLGKTFTGIGWLAVAAELAVACPSLQAGPHKPSLVLVPSPVVLKQWCDVLKTQFPQLNFVVAYGSQLPSWLSTQQWVNVAAVTQSSASAQASWPAQYAHVFDSTDIRNQHFIVLSTLDTWKDRTLVDLSPEAQPQETGKAQAKRQFECRWAGVFGRVLVDEAHEARNRSTRRWQMLRLINATTMVFLTATPVINKGQDIVSLAHLLWPNIQQRITEDPALAMRAREVLPTDHNITDIEAVTAKCRPDDFLRAYYFLNPASLDRVLRTDDPVYTQAFFREADIILCLRRSAESTLDMGDGSRLSLGTIMPPHIVRHVEVAHDPVERAEFEWLHRAATNAYCEGYTALAQEVRAKGGRAKEVTENSRNLARMTAAERRMMAMSTSTLLARLEHSCMQGDMPIKVGQLQAFRRRGVSAARFIQVVHRPTDQADLDTGLQRLRFITYGSPRIRYLLREIGYYALPSCSPDTSKLLVCEQLPLSTWFIELVCNLLHVSCGVIHSGLSEAEKVTLVDRFNDATSPLRLLIITYDLSMQGVNLYRCCSRVIVMCPARSAPLENQATGRPIRVLQTKTVEIVRVIVKDSHDAWLDLRQVNKSVSDLLTRALSPTTRQLVVELLNTANQSIRAAHESPEGQALLDGESTLPLPNGVAKTCGGRVVLKEEVLADEGRLETKKEEEPDTKPEAVPGQPSGAEPEVLDLDKESVAETKYDIMSLLIPGDESNSSAPLAQRKLRRTILGMAPDKQALLTPARMRLLHALSLDPDRTYRLRDLNEAEVLHRGLRLLVHRFLGDSDDRFQLTPHVGYRAIPPPIAERIASALYVDEARMTEAQSILRNPSAHPEL